MTALLIPVLVALLGGLAIGFQNPLAALMGQRVGLLQSAFIIHAGGAIAAAGALLVIPGGRLAAWRGVPWYALGAGVLGVVLVASVSYAIPRIGIAATVGLLIVAQLTIGAVLDHYGLLGVDLRALDLRRLMGVLLLLGGAWLLLR